jgi:sugar lactone lactonase YvrE
MWVSAAFALSVAVHAIAQSTDSSPYLFSTLAGVSSEGSADGTGTAARFFGPTGLTVTSDGMLYVTDTGNHTIRKITPAGVVTTVAGAAGRTGSTDGSAASARFRAPTSIQAAGMSPWGFYIADQGNHTIRWLRADNTVSTYTGVAGEPGSADGGSIARLRSPYTLSINTAGTIHFADTGNHTIRDVPSLYDFIRQTPVTTLAGSAGQPGFADGVGSAVRFDTPSGIVQLGVWLYVSDSGNSAIRKGHVTGRDFAIIGTAADPRQMATDFQNVYVAERGASRIRKISESGIDTILAGSATGETGWLDATGLDARFDHPEGVAADSAGNVYVGDTGNNVIRKIAASGAVTTLAGLAAPAAIGSLDGRGDAARFRLLTGVTADADGVVYVADTGNHTIRKVAADGTVSTLAGQAQAAGNADGNGSAARFHSPSGLAVDGTRAVFVADTGNSTIRRISTAGVVTTIAGSAGAIGAIDGNGAAARFNLPQGLAVDATGNLFVADTNNFTLRKIASDGTVTTVAGTAGVSGSTDGTGSAARFTNPVGVAVDLAGNVYVAEPTQHTIRKVTPAGVVTTLAGAAGHAGYADGTGAQALFNHPNAVAVDATGTVYVTDQGNYLVRAIASDGVVRTVAGLAEASGSADGLGEEARFSYVGGVAVDRMSTLYVTNGTALRKGIPARAPAIATQPQSQTVLVGGNVTFSVAATSSFEASYQWSFNGASIAGATASSYTITGVQASHAGTYAVTVTNTFGTTSSNAATLTVTTPPPPPPASGGSGGGAPSTVFLLSLLAMAIARASAARRAPR